MKILHVTPSYKPAFQYGGPIVSVSRLCEKLVSAGEEVIVYTTTANGLAELKVRPGKKTIVDGVPVIYFERILGDPVHFSPALLTRLWKMVSSYDVVHIHAWWNAVSVLSCLVATIKRKPVLLSPRGMLSRYSLLNHNSFLKWVIQITIGKLLLKRCAFHATSELERSDILQVIRGKIIWVIPNLIRLDGQVPNAERSPPGLFRLLFLSRIAEKKGLDRLLKALPAITVPWQLTIAGAGKESYVRQLKQLAVVSGLSGKVRWVGHLQGIAKSRCLAEHDLLVLPSHHESFGNVLLESLVAGTPVLTGPSVGLAPYITRSGMGWIAAPTPDLLAETITRAFYDPWKRKLIRDTAPRIIREDFDEEKIIIRYRKLYTLLKD